MSNVELDRMDFQTALNADWRMPSASLVVFVGNNGAGKSRLLGRIARSRKGRGDLLIANTPYDRFTDRLPLAQKLLVRSGTKLPERAFKQAILRASKSPIQLRKISRVLRHCHYDGAVGVQIILSEKEQDFRLSDIEGVEDERRVIASLSSLVRGYRLGGRIQWIDFDSDSALFSFESSLPLIVEREESLKKFGLLSNSYLPSEGRSRNSIKERQLGRAGLNVDTGSRRL
jgi:hypothetical protein